MPKCNSKYSCRQCRCKHHSLIHVDFTPSVVVSELPAEPPSNGDESSSTRVISAFSSNANQVFLPTARAQILDSAGNRHTIRILLDFGSQSNFIKGSLCETLNLCVEPANISVSGIGTNLSHVRTRCNVDVCAVHSSFKISLSCLVIDEITGVIPGFSCNLNSFKIPANIKLSDPTFHQPGDIALLLGAQVFFDILCIGQIRLGPSLPTIQKTRFGWVIAGGTVPDVLANPVSCNLSHSDDLSDTLNRFWEIEHYPTEKVFSEEENACKAHYVKHTRRASNGRFIVTIPFKDSVEMLGDSRDIARKRFLSLERRLEIPTYYKNIVFS